MGERSKQTKGARGRGGFRWLALPGDGVGVGAVEVPELLDLADELAQRGHLPHRRAAGAASARRRRPPPRSAPLCLSLSLSLSPPLLLLLFRVGSGRGFPSARLAPPPFPRSAKWTRTAAERSGAGDGVRAPRASRVPCACAPWLRALAVAGVLVRFAFACWLGFIGSVIGWRLLGWVWCGLSKHQ